MDRSKISVGGQKKKKNNTNTKNTKNRKADMINLDCDGFICA